MAGRLALPALCAVALLAADASAGGVRDRLDERGVFVQLLYNHFLSVKADGGGADRVADFGHSASYDGFLGADLERLAGWTGGSVLLHVKGQYDENVNRRVGALSDPIDDADFDEPIYVDELWLQQNWWGDRLRVRLGFLEQQTAFDRNAYANSEDRQFLSTYLDNDAVVPLPNGLGALIVVAPTDGVELAFGLADADNEPRSAGFDTFFDGFGSLSGYFEIALRGPRHSYRFGMFVDGVGRTDLGGYASLDQQVWREDRADEDQGLGVFARAGYGDRDTTDVDGFASVGFQYTGPLPRRDADVAGLAAYHATGSGGETGLELYYAISLHSRLVVTPDFQYIFDPGATAANGDVAVVTLRFRVRF